MNGALLMRRLIPPVTARTAEGRSVRAWDYKQKRNLVIAFCTPIAEPHTGFPNAGEIG